MQNLDTSSDHEISERDLARALQQQVAQWRASRVPLRTRTGCGVQVGRRSRRQQILTTCRGRLLLTP